MSGAVSRIGILIEHTGSRFKQSDDMIEYLDDGFAGLVAVKGLSLGLDRHFTIRAYQEEIGEGLVEIQFADGIVFGSIGDILHLGDMPLGIISASDKSVAAFPERIREVGFALEITCSEGAEEPVRSANIVGIKLQHTREIAPTEHIVYPL